MFAPRHKRQTLFFNWWLIIHCRLTKSHIEIFALIDLFIIPSVLFLFFLFVYEWLQCVLHHQVYHGTFTEFSTDLECFTSVF
jgi:hypothetical protein